MIKHAQHLEQGEKTDTKNSIHSNIVLVSFCGLESTVIPWSITIPFTRSFRKV